jgi:hypothetical protein
MKCGQRLIASSRYEWFLADALEAEWVKRYGEGAIWGPVQEQFNLDDPHLFDQEETSPSPWYFDIWTGYTDYVLIEVDGDSHDTDEQVVRDAKKRNDAMAAGYEVWHIRNEDCSKKNAPGTAFKIMEMLGLLGYLA